LRISSGVERCGVCALVLRDAEVLRRYNGAAAEVLDKWNAFFSSERGDFARGRGFDKTAHGEITAMHFEDERGLRPDGALVIGQRGLVRRADFAQGRAGCLQNFADPERSEERRVGKGCASRRTRRQEKK